MDTQKLLQKVDVTSSALAKIPELVEVKKWSSVKDVLTGPMEELVVTMNQLTTISTQQHFSSETSEKPRLCHFSCCRPERCWCYFEIYQGCYRLPRSIRQVVVVQIELELPIK